MRPTWRLPFHLFLPSKLPRKCSWQIDQSSLFLPPPLYTTAKDEAMAVYILLLLTSLLHSKVLTLHLPNCYSFPHIFQPARNQLFHFSSFSSI